MPTYVYIDEAADYFDRNIAIILSSARKYNVGMVLAHQYLGQLEPRLQEAFSANTSIKFAGGVSARDARALAPMMSTDAAFIEAQTKGSFAAYIRGVTKSALPLKFPFGYVNPHSGPWTHRYMVSAITSSIELAAIEDPKLNYIPQETILAVCRI